MIHITIMHFITIANETQSQSTFNSWFTPLPCILSVHKSEGKGFNDFSSWKAQRKKINGFMQFSSFGLGIMKCWWWWSSSSRAATTATRSHTPLQHQLNFPTEYLLLSFWNWTRSSFPSNQWGWSLLRETGFETRNGCRM